MAYINPKYPAIQVTQQEYDAMEMHNPHTMYCIPEAEPASVIITGTPTVQMSGAVLPINSTIYGTAEEVE